MSDPHAIVANAAPIRTTRPAADASTRSTTRSRTTGRSDSTDGARVLVTGAAGFVGSRLARVLVERGYDVHAVVRDRPGPAAGGRGLRLERCDLADTHSPSRELVARVEPELCFHCRVDRNPGCLPDVARERRPRGRRRAARTRARRRRMSAARRPRHVLRVRAERDPLSESSPLEPTTPYARAKLAAARAARAGV